MLITEKLITLTESNALKPFVFPTRAIIDEIYYQITLPTDIDKLYEEFYFTDNSSRHQFYVSIANFDINNLTRVKDDTNTEVNPFAYFHPLDDKRNTFAKIDNVLYINYRMKRGTYFDKMDSFGVSDKLHLKADYILTVRMLTDEDDEIVWEKSSQVLFYFIPIDYNKPYVLINPAITPYRIIRAYYYNVYQIYLVRYSYFGNFYRRWHLVSGDKAREIVLGRKEELFNAYIPRQYITTFAKYDFGIQDKAVKLTNSNPHHYVPVIEFLDDREWDMLPEHYLLLYGGRNSLPFIFCAFEVEELEGGVYGYFETR